MERLILEANSQDELIEKCDLFKVVIGQRTAAGGRPQKERELWVLKRVILSCDKQFFEFPLSIVQGDGPDFLIVSNGSEIGLEITEGCPPEDGREMAIGESHDLYFVGEFGGRKHHDLEGAKQNVRNDIQDAINAKTSKEYVLTRPTELWIYLNSIASTSLNGVSSDGKDWSSIYDALDHSFLNAEKFKRLFVYFSDDNVWEYMDKKFKRLIGRSL